jgi:hypothetical protein
MRSLHLVAEEDTSMYYSLAFVSEVPFPHSFSAFLVVRLHSSSCVCVKNPLECEVAWRTVLVDSFRMIIMYLAKKPRKIYDPRTHPVKIALSILRQDSSNFYLCSSLISTYMWRPSILRGRRDRTGGRSRTAKGTLDHVYEYRAVVCDTAKGWVLPL